MGKAEQKGSSLSISNFRVYSRNGTAIEDGESSCTNGPFWAYIWACGEWNTIKRLDFGTTPSQERQPRGRDQSFGRSFGLSWRGYEHKTTYSGWFSSSRPRCCAKYVPHRGHPADTDKLPVRTTRARIIYLKNDHKALMSIIEKHIHKHFARLAENGPEDEPMTNGSSSIMEFPSASEPQTLSPPFAKVNSVVADSPAESAGLKAGDQIRVFGYVNNMNHDELKRVAECVQGNEGREVLVKVSRAINGSSRKQELQLSLTPRRDWGGRGLLGCHILPL